MNESRSSYLDVVNQNKENNFPQASEKIFCWRERAVYSHRIAQFVAKLYHIIMIHMCQEEFRPTFALLCLPAIKRNFAEVGERPKGMKEDFDDKIRIGHMRVMERT